MTESQYLEFVNYSVEQLEQQLNEARRQQLELADYVAGRRKSKHKLGSLYFLNFVTWAHGMITTAERWE